VYVGVGAFFSLSLGELSFPLPALMATGKDKLAPEFSADAARLILNPCKFLSIPGMVLHSSKQPCSLAQMILEP
jgi:hypothetical protein